ncbi:hypothetical protein BS47DRAFT_710606 [Hydnum rufescens UP504]|uniref:Transmembrane protein n=1 Tax=Hydnum rufescens UP504 TaxID=1448309 RepID=A0A9P6DYI3_9AGAM|nr:hypothetical protein BS47DRAFT_710606 [Hydnum rufescens UP504]
MVGPVLGPIPRCRRSPSEPLLTVRERTGPTVDVRPIRHQTSACCVISTVGAAMEIGLLWRESLLGIVQWNPHFSRPSTCKHGAFITFETPRALSSLNWSRRVALASSKNRASASAIPTPSPSPPNLVIPKRKVRISIPRNTSPTIEQQQRHEIQSRLDSTINPNPSHSSNPIFLASSDSSDSEIGAPLISVIGMMFCHPLSTIGLLPPAQTLFLLGFILGPWTWLLGGWIMTPDGQFHTVDREGDVVDPSPFAKNRSVTSVATTRSVREGLGSTVVGNNSTLELLDSQRIRGPNASRESLTSQKYPRSRRIRSRSSKVLLKLSGLFPLWSDSPCEWVWKCRIAALCSAAVILAAFIVACYAANHGHF